MTAAQADALLARYGPNAIPVEGEHPMRIFARRLWGPIPWVLEAALVLTLASHRYGDGVAIAFLLLFNAAVASWQEGKARGALDLLRSRIVVQARVVRDGSWTALPADRLVPGDVIHLGLGDVVPADVRVLDGTIDADESALTGESLSRSITVGAPAYAGTIVRRGSAVAEVTGTGSSTKFGHTAELVRIAKTKGTLERLVTRLVASLSAIALVVIAIVTIFGLRYGLNGVDIALFAVIIALASVPVALPAAFTLATAFGSLDLARSGAFVTRLSAIEDAASMDVLCTDKTGTITENRITVQAVVAYAPFAARDVAALAASSSDEAEQDPIDLAAIRYARELHADAPPRKTFTAFDPALKYSSASILWQGGDAAVYKGAPSAVQSMVSEPPATLSADLEKLAATGARVIAVAVRSASVAHVAGLVALADTVRPDARALVTRLHDLGIEVTILTGDAAATALHVAQQVGIPPSSVRASVYPEEKLAIIRDLQRGHVVGMTGDGINDAPALRQANIGIAVSTATDVAKAAAGVVLTQAGLSNVVQAIETGRQVYERMLTYTMMKLVKYFEIVGVLTVGFFATRSFLLTPELMVALLVFNDFITLSLATDNVSVSHGLDVWHIGRMLAAAISLAILTMASVLLVLGFAIRFWHPNLGQLQSAAFLALAAMGQFAVFAVRERRAFFRTPPSRWLVAAASLALVACSAIVLGGAISAPLPGALVAMVVGLLAACALLVNVAKLPVFSAAGLR